ncbi:MAG: hypothetical protein Q9221_004175 [Calogaya cf. arnoldii]
MYFLLLVGLLPMLLNYVTAIPADILTLPKLATTNDSNMDTSELIKIWADQARHYPWRTSPLSHRAIDILEAMFEGKDTPERTAAKLAEIYNPALKAGFQLSPVFALWGMMCEAMRILGGDMEIDKNLVQLLNTLARLPDVTDEKGKPIGPGGGYGGVYWKDLPAMPIMFREYAIGTYAPKCV